MTCSSAIACMGVPVQPQSDAAPDLLVRDHEGAVGHVDDAAGDAARKHTSFCWWRLAGMASTRWIDSAVRARQQHLARSPLSNPAHVGRPNRPAGLRTDPTRPPRHHLGAGPYVRCHGTGPQRPRDPAARPHVSALTTWLHEYNCGPTDPVFPTRRGRPLSTDAVAWLLTKHAATAARRCPSLNDNHLTPHVLRHTAAMQLLPVGLMTVKAGSPLNVG
jgi:hypothetical protein